MKKIEFYLNIIHFCYYKAHFRLHLLLRKINPVRLIHKLPFQKKRYEQLGINIDEQINRAFSDKNFGISITVAGGFLFGVLSFCFWGLFGVINKLFITNTLSNIHFIIFGLFSFVVCYFFIFKNDIYLNYFNKFEKLTKEEKRKYNWITFFITVFVFTLWICSW